MLHNSRKIAAVDGVVFASALLVNVASAHPSSPLATSVLSNVSMWDNIYLRAASSWMGGTLASQGLHRLTTQPVYPKNGATCAKSAIDYTLCSAALLQAPKSTTAPCCQLAPPTNTVCAPEHSARLCCAGLFVTSVLGSVFRAVLTVSRTAFIWAFDVALYYSAWSYGAALVFRATAVCLLRLEPYCMLADQATQGSINQLQKARTLTCVTPSFADGQLGEAWDSRSSPIQLVGFVLGLAGTLVYAQGTTRRGPHLALPADDPFCRRRGLPRRGHMTRLLLLLLVHGSSCADILLGTPRRASQMRRHRASRRMISMPSDTALRAQGGACSSGAGRRQGQRPAVGAGAPNPAKHLLPRLEAQATAHAGADFVPLLGCVAATACQL